MSDNAKDSGKEKSIGSRVLVRDDGTDKIMDLLNSEVSSHFLDYGIREVAVEIIRHHRYAMDALSGVATRVKMKPEKSGYRAFNLEYIAYLKNQYSRSADYDEKNPGIYEDSGYEETMCNPGTNLTDYEQWISLASLFGLQYSDIIGFYSKAINSGDNVATRITNENLAGFRKELVAEFDDLIIKSLSFGIRKDGTGPHYVYLPVIRAKNSSDPNSDIVSCVGDHRSRAVPYNSVIPIEKAYLFPRSSDKVEYINAIAKWIEIIKKKLSLTDPENKDLTALSSIVQEKNIKNIKSYLDPKTNPKQTPIISVLKGIMTIVDQVYRQQGLPALISLRLIEYLADVCMSRIYIDSLSPEQKKSKAGYYEFIREQLDMDEVNKSIDSRELGDGTVRIRLSENEEIDAQNYIKEKGLTERAAAGRAVIVSKNIDGKEKYGAIVYIDGEPYYAHPNEVKLDLCVIHERRGGLMCYAGKRAIFLTYEEFANLRDNVWFIEKKRARPGMGAVQTSHRENIAKVIAGIALAKATMENYELIRGYAELAQAVSKNSESTQKENCEFTQDWKNTGIVVHRENHGELLASYISEIGKPDSNGYKTIISFDNCYPQYGLIREGENAFVIPPIYDCEVLSMGDGLYKICRNAQWGYVNSEGKEIIRPGQYAEVHAYSQGRIVVKETGGYYRILKIENGKVVNKLPGSYEWASDFIGGFCVVGKSGKEGLIRLDGTVAVSIEYDEISSVLDGKVLFAKNGVIIEKEASELQ